MWFRNERVSSARERKRGWFRQLLGNVLHRVPSEDIDGSAAATRGMSRGAESGESARTLRAIQSAWREAAPRDEDPGISPTEIDTTPDEDLEFLRNALTDYEILDRLRHGGQGVVYRAYHQKTKRTVAIKILLAGPFATARQRIRFEREAELTSRLQHPNIVTLYDYGVVRGRPYLAMQYVDGLPIDDYVVLHDLPPRQTISLFAAVCRAVGYAHQNGIIHRDLSPSNILIDASGQPHVLDFGLAKDLWADEDSTRCSVAGQAIGTLPYLSPEQADGGDEAVDVRSDVYSLGVVLYGLLTDVMPYPVDGSPQRIRSTIRSVEPLPLRKAAALGDSDRLPERGSINRDLEMVLCRVLAKDPAERYQSATDFADDLERYLAGDVVTARAGHRLYVMRKVLRRHRVFASVATLLLAVLIVASIAVTMSWDQTRAQRDQARTLARLAHSAFNKTLSEIDENIRVLAGGTAARDRILGHVAEDLSQLNELVRSDVEMRDLLAAMHEKQGDIADARGQHVEAAQHYSAFLTISRELATTTTTPDQYLRDVARAHRKLADVSQKPEQHHQDALNAARLMVSRDPLDADAQYALCEASVQYGRDLYQRGEYGAAAEHLAAAIEICVSADSNGDNSDRWAALQATALEWRGEVEVSLDERGATESHLRSLQIRQALVERQPTNVEWRHKLLLSHIRLATLYGDQGRNREAVDLFEKAASVGEYLVATDPHIATWKQDLAGVHHRLAMLLLASGQQDDAKVHCAAAAALTEELVRTDPTGAEWKNLLAYVKILSGRISLLADEFQSAIEHFQMAATIRAELVAHDPNNLRNIENLANAYAWLGRSYSKDGQLDSALTYYSCAYDAYWKLACRQPDIADRIYDAARCQINLAAVHIKQRVPEHDASARDLLAQAEEKLASMDNAESLPHRQKLLEDHADAIRTNLRILECPPSER